MLYITSLHHIFFIGGTARLFGQKTPEVRLAWFGHVRTKDDGYIRTMLSVDLPVKRKREKPKRRYMHAVRDDMAVVEVTEEDAEVDRNTINGDRKSTVATPAGETERRSTIILFSLQFVSPYSCTSYAGIIYFVYNNTSLPRLPVLPTLSIPHFIHSLFTQYSVIHIICGRVPVEGKSSVCLICMK